MIAEHHETGEGHIKLGRADPYFHLTFEGFNGLETTIYFDHVNMDGETAGFYQHGDQLVAELELRLKFQRSSVASALRAIQHNQLTPNV